LTDQPDKVTVQVRYKDVEKNFSGSPEDAWLFVNKFFNEFLPTFEIAKKLTLSIDLQNLAKQCEGIIAFSKEGPNLLVSRNSLTDNETLALSLLASHVCHDLGMYETDEMSKEELQAKLGKDAKITSTRLGELVKNEMARRTADDRYCITTLGVSQMQKDILPRIKAKISK